MGRQKTEDIVKAFSEPITGSLDLELVDVEYVKEGATWFLRVYIDKPEGVTHNDCQAVSERLGEVLDENDPVPHSFVLEVSSPGIERPLKKAEDFIRFRGSKVRVSTFAPVDGTKEFVGLLEGLEDGNIKLNVDSRPVSLPSKSVAKVRLEADF